MRILMTGVGADEVATDWAKAAGRFSEIVSLHVTRQGRRPHYGTSASPQSSVVEEAGFPAITARLPPALRPNRFMWPLNDRLALSPLMQAIEDAKHRFGAIDLIHTHRYAGAAPIARVAERQHIPLIHTEHSSALIHENPYRRVSRAGLKQARILYSRAAVVLFVSDQLREAATAHGLTGRFEVVPNPLDADQFHPRRRTPSQTIRLINVGSLIPVKRHELILEALAMARAREPRLHLQILGTGPLESLLREQVIRLGLSDAVDLLGSVSRTQVASHMADADIYIHSSAVETFGVAVVEALFCGLPVVATDSGGVVSTLTSPPCKLVSPNPEDMAGAILEIAGELDFYDREEIATGARGAFGLDSVAEKLRRIYSDVLRTSEMT